MPYRPPLWARTGAVRFGSTWAGSDPNFKRVEHNGLAVDQGYANPIFEEKKNWRHGSAKEVLTWPAASRQLTCKKGLLLLFDPHIFHVKLKLWATLTVPSTFKLANCLPRPPPAAIYSLSRDFGSNC